MTSTEATTEMRKRGIYRRITLRRADGQVYLNRWGLSHDRIGGILLHRMDAPDPGLDLHDHPWWFVSIILWGGYTEERADIAQASARAARADQLDGGVGLHNAGVRGTTVKRRWLSVRTMRQDECHTITELHGPTSWSLVIKGPRLRSWGFYPPEGYMPAARYAAERAERRQLYLVRSYHKSGA